MVRIAFCVAPYCSKNQLRDVKERNETYIHRNTVFIWLSTQPCITVQGLIIIIIFLIFFFFTGLQSLNALPMVHFHLLLLFFVFSKNKLTIVAENGENSIRKHPSQTGAYSQDP